MTEIAEILAENTKPLFGQRKGSAIYHAVRRAILLRHLEPGLPLLEQQIAVGAGCSQGTVREALMRPQQDGLVTRRGYHGTVVSDTTLEEAAQMACIRLELETAGIRSAVPVVKASVLSDLEGILAAMEVAKQADDSYALSELDRDFHLTIFQTAKMPALEPVLTRCALHVHRYTFGNPPAGKGDLRLPPPGAEQHRDVLRVVKEHCPEHAAAVLRGHILEVIEYWAPSLFDQMARISSAVRDRTAAASDRLQA